MLVSNRNQPLTGFDDLRGQNIAIVDRSALLVIAGAVTLADNGLQENADYRFVETVSHSSALHNAITGKARAALVSYSTRLHHLATHRDASRSRKLLINKATN